MKYEVIDLAKAGAIDQVNCELCIIGGGAAGLFVAAQLAIKGLKIIMLEAGPEFGKSPKEMGFVPRFLADYYPGAIDGRAFGLGGSTSRWGGLLIPHSKYDLRNGQSEKTDVTWTRIVEVVSLQSEKVLHALGYSCSSQFESYSEIVLGRRTELLRRAGLDTQASIFLPFRRKNFSYLLKKNVTARHTIQIYENAVAKDWEVRPTSDGTYMIDAVSAISSSGSKVRVCANRFILAAGTIESARILLEIQTQHRDALSLSKQIGRCLGDHLSLAIAEVDKNSLKLTNSVFAPRFQSHWMRSFRFIESNLSTNAPRAFAHFVFDNHNAGFLLAKKVLSSLQAKKLPRTSFSEAIRGLAGVTGLAINRFFRSKLYIPGHTNTHLQLDMEQTACEKNYVSLGGDIDRFGRPEAQIHWSISQCDLQNIRSLATTLIDRWNSIGEGLPTLIPRQIREDSQKPHDAYHPVGVCRMGHDDESVVDLDLKVRGLGNLWNVTTGVFPTAGTANPTFSMLCLAQNLVDQFGTESR